MKKFKSLKTVVKNNWIMFWYSMKTVPLYTFMSCFGRAFHAGLIFFEHTYMIKFIIDCIQYKRPFLYALIYIAVIFLTVTLWMLFLNFYNAKYRRKNRELLIRKLRFEIYNKASIVDISSYDNPEFYNDYVWSMQEIDKRVDTILNTISNLFTGLINILTGGIFMISYDLVGIFCVLISFIGTFIINSKIGKLRYNLSVALRPFQRKQDYISRVLYMKDYAKEVRLNNIKNKLYCDYDEEYENIQKLIKKSSKKIAFLSFSTDYILSSFLFNGVYILYLAYNTIFKRIISYGSMAALFQSCGTLKGGLSALTTSLPQFYENSLYIEKIKKFLTSESYLKNESKAKSVDKLPLIEFRNVSFSYPNERHVCLKNINMIIKPNQKIAIVGYNGAGKSTLINLLLRLYDVKEGKIIFNGNNIKDYELKEYRNNYGVLFQDYQIYAATVSENVAMDVVSNHFKRIFDALDLSGFGDKLKALQNGLNTELTREYDDGVELSGGEIQKIALARSIYKDSKIIILDEPSSALDPISEYRFNQTISEIAKEKVVIYISHRLSTTRMADVIYMFEDGEIIEQGTHDELIYKNGKYAEMFNLQAQKYKCDVVN